MTSPERPAEAAEPNDQIEALSATIADLKAQLATEHRPPKKGRWRAPVSAILIVLGVILAPLGVVAGWAKSELVSTDQFVATFGPLIDDPSVQAEITEQVVTLVEDQVDIEGLTQQVIQAIVDIDGMPEKIKELLPTFESSIQGWITSGLTTATQKIVSSDIVSKAWNEVLSLTHDQLEKTLNDDPNSAITISNDGTLSVEIGPIIAKIKQALIDNGVSIASYIPEVKASYPIMTDSSLPTIKTAYSLAVEVGTYLPIVALGLLVVGVLVARKKARTLIWAGLGLAAAMGVFIAALDIGSVVARNQLQLQGVLAGATDAVYSAVTDNMATTSQTLIILGVVLAIVTYVVGPFEWSGKLRAAMTKLAAGWRDSAAANGVSTGHVGVIMYRQRILFGVLVGAVAAAIIVFVKPLTPSLIVWTAIISVIVLMLFALLARPGDAAAVVHRPTPVKPVSAGLVEQTVVVPKDRGTLIVPDSVSHSSSSESSTDDAAVAPDSTEKPDTPPASE